MATISNKAISNNHKLTGAEINLREGIASFCSFDNPSTAQTLVNIAARIGMDKGQAQKVMTKLEENGEVKKYNGRYYLLQLDPEQIDRISKKNYELLKTLAVLGCEEAKSIVDKESTLNDSESTLSRFLLHFFLFSQLTQSQQKLTGSQPQVDTESTKVDRKSTPFKGNNGVDVLNNGVMEEAEEGLHVACKGDEIKTAAAAADSDIPDSGDSADPHPEKLNGTTRKKLREEWIHLHKRKDLDTAAWHGYLQKLPECKNIKVQKLWSEMLKWCHENHKQASRGRFLNWVLDEIDDVPEEIVQEEKSAENQRNFATDSRGRGAKNAVGNRQIINQLRRGK